MIEKETDGEDRGKIASVIYNRLNNPGASAGTNGYLQIDAPWPTSTGARCPPRRTSPSTPPTIPICIPAAPRPHRQPRPGIHQGRYGAGEHLLLLLYPGDDNKHHFFNTYGEMTSFMSTQALYSGG